MLMKRAGPAAPTQWQRRFLPLLVSTVTLACGSLQAAICTVPGSHSTIQAAIGDLTCSELQLQDQAYPEVVHITRGLELGGPVNGDAAVLGQLAASGGSTNIVLSELRIEGNCPDGVLRVTSGAQLVASKVRVKWNNAVSCQVELIFRNGFEN